MPTTKVKKDEDTFIDDFLKNEIDFISEKTGFNKDMIKQMLDADYEYLLGNEPDVVPILDDDEEELDDELDYEEE